MKREKHVVVVGAGVIGLCCAYHLVRRGLRVTVVDAGRRGGDNCSAKNAGMVVPSHVVPLAAPGMVALGMKMLFSQVARSPSGPTSAAGSCAGA